MADALLPIPEIYLRLALALAIGLAVGAERGWRLRERGPGERSAGVRTYTLIGFLGGLLAVLGTLVGDIVLVLGFVAFAVLIGAVYIIGVVTRSGADRGMTSEVASLITFVLGVLAVRGDMTLAAVSAVVLVTVLDIKEPLHRGLEQIKDFELTAAIKLALISVVMLPLLPDKGYGPDKIWNPYELWWMVVLIAGISFGGYFAIRLAGARIGPLLMGFLGGLASSTALTVSSARLAGRVPRATTQLAAGVAVSVAVMFVRTIFLASLLMPDLGQALALVFGAAALGALACAVFWSFNGHDDPEMGPLLTQMATPDDMRTALQFGAILMAVITLSHYANVWMGDTGVYSVAALSGLVDVDAVTLSMSRLAGDAAAAVPLRAAVIAVMVAVFVNMAVKIVLAGVLAGGEMALRVAGLFLAALAAGGAALFYGGLPG